MKITTAPRYGLAVAAIEALFPAVLLFLALGCQVGQRQPVEQAMSAEDALLTLSEVGADVLGVSKNMGEWTKEDYSLEGGSEKNSVW